MKTIQYSILALCMFVGSFGVVSAQYYQYPYQYSNNQYYYSNTQYPNSNYVNCSSYSSGNYYHHHMMNDNDCDDQTYEYSVGCDLYQYNPYTRSSVLIGSTCPTNNYNNYNYSYPYTTSVSYPYQYQNYQNNVMPYQNFQSNTMYIYRNGSWNPWVPSMNQYQSNTCYYQNGYTYCY